jgi:hypothetical protein
MQTGNNDSSNEHASGISVFDQSLIWCCKCTAYGSYWSGITILASQVMAFEGAAQDCAHLTCHLNSAAADAYLLKLSIDNMPVRCLSGTTLIHNT